MPRLSNPQCGRLRFAPVLSAGICACLSGSFVHAADFIVPTGTTAGQQILSGIGDTGLIEAGGVIASPVTGVLMNNADQAVTNLGLISTTGFFASGVGAYGVNAEINNLGAITTTGTVGIGIFATAGNALIYNGGHISTSGVFGVGLLTTGLAARMENTGTITTTGISAHGIYSLGLDGLVTNSGVISTTGIGGVGALFLNSGTLINSGQITAENANAIQFLAGDDTLTLLPGSVIDGAIDLGGGTNTLNVGSGLNIATTFNSAPPEIGTIGSQSYVVSGNQVIVVDPTGFTGSSVFLSDVTSSIQNVLESHSGNGMPMEGISTHSDELDDLFENNVSSRIHNWVSGFGGYQLAKDDLPLIDLEHSYGGLIVGLESRTGEKVAGVFGGGVRSRMDVDFDAQDLEIDGAFGGGYANQDNGSSWIGLSFIGGLARHDSRRRVANNTVTGGIETARAEYDGWFAAPSVTLGGRLEPGIDASVRLAYAGLYLEEFSETGVVNPISATDRAIHLFGARAQFAFPSFYYGNDGSYTRIEWRTGVDGRYDIGSDDIAGTVAGLPINFTAVYDRPVSGFLGASFHHAAADGLHIVSASFEAQSAFGRGYQLTGTVKATRRF